LAETRFIAGKRGKFLPLYHKYLDEVESHLRAGWNYTNTLPFFANSACDLLCVADFDRRQDDCETARGKCEPVATARESFPQ